MTLDGICLALVAALKHIELKIDGGSPCSPKNQRLLKKNKTTLNVWKKNISLEFILNCCPYLQ